MKKAKSLFTFYFSLLTLLLCVSAVNLQAQSGGTYEIKRSVIANGGTQSDGGVFSITGTIGQGAAGTYNGNGRYAMRSGFWTNPVPRILNGKICYTNGGDIWKMDPDGSNRQLVIDAGTNDIEPAWSPDGSKIAFKSDRDIPPGRGLYSVNADGTGLTLLTNGGVNNSDAKPTWSPDGTKIAFQSNRDNLISSIYIMNADGSNVVRLTNALPISDQRPAWSPDGTKIVFEINTGIAIIDIDGTGRTNLGSGQFPEWSPDGSRIVFALITGTGYHIYTMKPDGTDITQLTFDIARNDQYPSFSPDGRKIVFSRNTSGQIGLWTMNADGSGLVIFSGTNTIGNGYSDWQRAPNTPVAAPATLRIDEATITFANVTSEGNTTFAPITPTQGQLPPGFALCPTCPAYDIVTTAAYTPPVTVCLQVPSMTNMATFTALRLFHSEGGVFIDRTSGRDFATRVVCATVSSLSPFVLAENLTPTSANVSVSGRVLTAHGQGIRNARVTLTSSTGAPRTAITGSFGYYRFDDVEVGQTYIVSVRSKRFQFSNPTQVITLLDELTDLTFTALPE
ncbi:MAG: carboxypeptidase regulatory-like domain-containing protein [Pyrinomonadaceae bacterium]